MRLLHAHEITQQSSLNNISTEKAKNLCLAAVSTSVKSQLIPMTTLMHIIYVVIDRGLGQMMQQ